MTKNGQRFNLWIKNSLFIIPTGRISNNFPLDILQAHLALMPPKELCFIIIDEITYVKEWDKGIKFLADAGVFDNVMVVLTGSDLILMQEARMRFPGRRGKADQVDFHIYPLSFKEFVDLKNPTFKNTPDMDKLFSLFDAYLIHGGFLTAINDCSQLTHIAPATFNTYVDWIRGDCLKQGKNDFYLKEFLQTIIKTYGTQVTWNNLVQHMSIEHHKTIQEYAETLASMDALFIQRALLEHKLTAAPKKAKKLFFTDPFIYHAINKWLDPDYTPIASPTLVEGCVVTHIRRFYPTYYIKAEGEVDVAYIHKGQFWPIEIKWTNQLRPKDLKQIAKYKNGIILGKNHQEGTLSNLPALPLPAFLYQL